MKYFGKKYVPMDNSFSISLFTKKDAYLAGTMMKGDYPKECVIVSEPYDLKVEGAMNVYTYINVMYDNEVFRVLFNCGGVDAKIDYRRHDERSEYYENHWNF